MVRKMEALESRLLASPVHKNPNLEELYGLCAKKAQVMAHVSQVLSEHCVFMVSGDYGAKLGTEGLEESSDHHATG